MAEKRIKVACRIRPKMQKLSERYDIECIKKADEENLVITQPAEEGEKPKQHFFSFDHVFDESDTQREIYNEASLDMIDLVLEGTNATILAYGQTGSGKTFTVLGDVSGDGTDEGGNTTVTPGSGLFLRALTDLFTYKDRSRRTLEVTISLSILEIYVDELRDLLAKKAKLVLREVDDDVQIPNLTTVEVETLGDVYKYYKIANAERSVTATGMNDVSSRSHAVFIVDLEQAERTNSEANPLLSAEVDANKAKDPKVCGVEVMGQSPGLQRGNPCCVGQGSAFRLLISDPGLLVRDPSLLISDPSFLISDAGLLISDAGLLISDAGLPTSDASC